MKNQILNLSKQLIRIPSTKDKPENLKKTLEIIKKHLEGFTLEEFESNGVPSLLAYTGKTRPKKFKLILNGHTDVVSAPNNLFIPKIKGNRLYGRGAIDMKSSVAVITLVFKKLANKLNYPLGLQIVCDEEIGGFDGTKHQIQKGVKADLVIAGEFSDFNIATQAKGILWLELTVQGQAGHGAHPWLGKNAIKLMSDNIQAISKLYPVPKKEIWKTTCNISKISAGESVNQIPDTCTCSLDIRYLPGENPNQIIHSIKQNTKATNIKTIFKEPTHHANSHHELINSLKSTIIKTAQQKVLYLKRHGGSDCRHYSRKNIASIEFGPIGAGLHSNKEWVDIKSLNTYYSILTDYLNNL